jgi:predicted AAA+ superfamily ATPase
LKHYERKTPSLPLVVLDEIHKYGDWKNYLKGTYDRYYNQFRFPVTGSGRPDIYRKGGDSPVGRYYLFHLWPFKLAKSAGKTASGKHLQITRLSAKFGMAKH